MYNGRWKREDGKGGIANKKSPPCVLIISEKEGGVRKCVVGGCNPSNIKK
jgi:hypothetical protein